MTKAPTKSPGTYARSKNTRSRILDAAMIEATECGFQYTSMAKIAARAGVAVGILNYHFQSRKELLRQIMKTQRNNFLSSFVRPETEEDFFTHEENLVADYLMFLHANPNFVRLSEEARLHDPDLYYEGIEDHANHICGRIKRGIKHGDLRAMSTDEIISKAYFILGSLTFLDRLLHCDNCPDDKEIIKSYVGILRNGLSS